MLIYKITNIINNKIYIGQTIRDLKFRIYDYKKDKNRYAYGIYAAIKKYGFENFTFEILDKAENQQDLNNKEIQWIEKLDSCDKKIGYNIRLGGKGRGKWREEEKTMQSIKRQGFNKGRKLTEESKNKIKASWIIRKELGQVRNKGFFVSNETKEKIRKSRIGKYNGVNGPNSKSVICVETGTIFYTITDAAKFLNRKISTLSSHLSGISKKCAGYTFKYI